MGFTLPVARFLLQQIVCVFTRARQWRRGIFFAFLLSNFGCAFGLNIAEKFPK
jgi:hypothetical protein